MPLATLHNDQITHRQVAVSFCSPRSRNPVVFSAPQGPFFFPIDSDGKVRSDWSALDKGMSPFNFSSVSQRAWIGQWTKDRKTVDSWVVETSTCTTTNRDRSLSPNNFGLILRYQVVRRAEMNLNYYGPRTTYKPTPACSTFRLTVRGTVQGCMCVMPGVIPLLLSCDDNIPDDQYDTSTPGPSQET